MLSTKSAKEFTACVNTFQASQPLLTGKLGKPKSSEIRSLDRCVSSFFQAKHYCFEFYFSVKRKIR